METITRQGLREFEEYLYDNEKAEATVRKYVCAVVAFGVWLDGRELGKRRLLEYRDALLEGKKARTVNGELSAIHSYLKFRGLESCKVRFLKVQHQPFLEETRELREAEYKCLLETAKNQGKERLYLVMMTICSTGIRVGELASITVEAARSGYANIHMKGKCRRILLPRDLCKRLLDYAKRRGITSGHLFRTRSGRPLDRTNIGHEMKKLCAAAGVDPRKVFPHNLRHLFARCFIAVENNLAHLADVLGHSRIETTRLYVAVSAETHIQILNKMQLVI